MFYLLILLLENLQFVFKKKTISKCDTQVK